ncbi:MAG: strawberry notch C-terminal domain-containing protein [Solirubrobacteraceae bacterium]
MGCRLGTLGAITRGQRQTGGQGLFRAADNLESGHTQAALRRFYQMPYTGTVEGGSLGAFRGATGLDLSFVNLFRRKIDRAETELDRDEQAPRHGQAEQDGSEVKSVALERRGAEPDRAAQRLRVLPRPSGNTLAPGSLRGEQ